MSTAWSYLSNSGDRRLAAINNVGLAQSQFSNFQFTTTPENFISAITETSDSAAVYPSPGSQTATYNNVNALTNLSGQAFTYDANGNLLSDGQRNYTWDAENRLIGITYPAQPSKQTAFVYDGLNHRTAITSTPAGGGGAVTTSYIWCGARPCQARTASNAVTRSYYVEGEFVPGTPAQSYYYGPDQIGSVRRVFASTSNAPAYRYDPYGNPLQATAPLTDFGYAGMFYNADSGLYLTQYRAYNPVTGRWLSRDPLGESSDQAANLYAYVGGNPITYVDPLGLAQYPTTPPPPEAIPGGPWTWSGDDSNSRGGKWVGTAPPGEQRPEASWDDKGAHWDVDYGEDKGRQRFNRHGAPLTKEEAHSKDLKGPPRVPLPTWPRAIPPIFILRSQMCPIDPSACDCI